MAKVETLFSKEYEINGYKLIIDIVPSMSDIIQKFADELEIARGIPRDIDNLHPLDPMVNLTIQKVQHLKDGTERSNRAVDMARRHYYKLKEETMRDAVAMAIARKTPRLDFVPKPYEKQDEPEELFPGAGQPLPSLRKSLDSPIEIRLKQIMDLLEASPEAAFEIVQNMNNLARLWETEVEEKDPDGFHDESADTSGSSKKRGKSVESSA
jgi:hypothetical protein